MTLTGLPLIFLTAFLTLLAIAGTVLLWSRYGRWRLLSRAVGVLLAEVLTVATVGLVVNRLDGFYPSWQALRGDTGTVSQTAARPPAGRLDATLGHMSALPWQPADLGSWGLAGPPTIVLPHGYPDRPAVDYPVVLMLVDDPRTAAAAARVAARADGVVTVVAIPGAATTADALRLLATDLRVDVRVTTHGWALVSAEHDARLAAQLIDGDPGRYVAEALVGPGQAPVVVHEVASTPGRPAKELTLTCPRGSGWSVAAGWAADETSGPLQPAIVLPAGAP